LILEASVAPKSLLKHPRQHPQFGESRGRLKRPSTDRRTIPTMTGQTYTGHKHDSRHANVHGCDRHHTRSGIADNAFVWAGSDCIPKLELLR
jgi:hypothetical protein